MKTWNASINNLLLLSFLAVLGLGGCKGAFQKKSDAVNGSSGDLRLASLAGLGGLEGFKQSVWPLARRDCAGCHGAAQKPWFAVTDAQVAFSSALPLVNFESLPDSKFLQKVKDGHCGKACTTDGKEMESMLSAWKSAYSQAEAPAGPSVPKGNVFTATMLLPTEDEMKKKGCNLPANLTASPDLPGNVCWSKLRFPLNRMLPLREESLARAWFEIDFSYENYTTNLGAASYVIKNPRVVSPDTPVYVFDIKLFINGEYRPEYGAAYRMIDTVVDVATFGPNCKLGQDPIPAAPTAFDPNLLPPNCIPATQPLFSTAASSSGIVQERKDRPDSLVFSFEYLQKGIVGDCRNSKLFMENVYRPISMGAVACLDCHRSGGVAVPGQIVEAGQRFNMDVNDPVNIVMKTVTDANGVQSKVQDFEASLKNVCRKFLQRSNQAMPAQSPIIVQPKVGLNGMPAQPNFNYFSPNWIAWIESEADLAKAAADK